MITKKDYKSLSKEENEKSDNMVVTDTKNPQKMKNKSCLSTKKNVIKQKMRLIATIKNYFHLDILFPSTGWMS